MSHKRGHKRNLSKGILEMKFMKKSKEKVDKEKEELESKDLFADNINKGKNSEGAQYIIEQSMVPIESLLNGRMSFRGMNPEVERLMQEEMHHIQEKQKALERLQSNQPEISDAEMARRLGKTVAKKFKNKNRSDSEDDSENEDNSDEEEKRPAKKAKFLKPKDD
ncbi:M-phase phosphoprotein 6 [Thrips palmi]|uniref:M-phase phosphoprotein 6 n=1 Tax=Thrips palmi TaxID=161013 RepID=A0A6P8ZKW2_THRPL|nr:M-phase phosphoprotein 6 [Thrips palmi]